MRGVKEAITWDIIPGVSPPWRSWSPLVAFHPLPVVLFFNTQSGQRNRHQKIYITLSKSTFWLRDDQSKSEAYRKSRESCEKGDYADANLKSCRRVLANLTVLDHYYIRWYFTIFSSSLQPRSCQWSTTTVSPTLSHGVKCQKRVTFLTISHFHD